MRAGKVFIDSNALLYSVDEDELEKRSTAQDWLLSLSRSATGVTNLQVLNEATNVLLKRRQNVEASVVFAIVEGFARFGSEPLRAMEVRSARRLRLRFGHSWWDCLLLASAIEHGCTHFLSEDLQNGHTVEGLTIVDPFAHTPEDILSPR